MKIIEPTEDNLKIYNQFPVFLQNIACSLKGYQLQRTRYNSAFAEMLRKFNERSNWSYEQICEYRDERLRNIVSVAYNTVPYYRRVFDEGGIDYHSIKTIDDLSRLPITTKDDIINNYSDFQSVTFNTKARWPAHTSGTTGTGLRFYTTEESAHAQWACFWRMWQRLGIQRGEWCANFGNKLIVPRSQTKPPFWRISRPGHQVYFSAYHENDANLYHYYRYISEKKLRWIHGYPSLITTLASYMLNQNLTFPHDILFVTTSAENLLPYQIKSMEQAFGVRPLQIYSQTEEVAVFHQNIDGNIYVDDDFSAVEFLSIGNDQYSIVGTNIYNTAFPFIRYATKDTVTLPDSLMVNGRRTVKSIDGRLEDYIYFPDGTKVGKLYHIFENTTSFTEVQLYQKTDYSIIIYAVKRRENVSEDERRALNLMKLSIGDAVPFEFCYVDRIPRTKGGKLRFIVSEVKQ